MAPKLTLKQLNAISVRFLIANSRNHNVRNTESFHNYVKQHIAPFCIELASEKSDYQHLEYAGCGTVSFLNNDIYACFKANYAGVLSTGFDEEAIKTLNLDQAQRSKLIIPCLRNPTKFQIPALEDEAINIISKQCGLNEGQITQIKNLQNSHVISKEALENEMTKVSQNFADLLHTWNNTGLGSLQLTTVGIALAHANIKKTIGVDLDLSIWIK